MKTKLIISLLFLSTFFYSFTKEKTKFVDTKIVYELINVYVVGSPIDNEDGVSRDWYINVVSNIQGNNCEDFYNTSTTKFNFLKTDSQAEIQSKMILAGQTYINSHYPCN